MPSYDRGGYHLTSLKLGRATCLRQELVTPGETIESALRGQIIFSALRRPIVTQLEITLAAFYTPMRFVTPTTFDWVQYINEGPQTALTIPLYSLGQAGDDDIPWDCLGLGTLYYGDTIPWMFYANWLKIWNWYFKWPEATDATSVASGLEADEIKQYGRRVVNKESYATRWRDNSVHDDTIGEVAATDDFDVRDLERIQAGLREHQDREWFGTRGYRELVNQIWNTMPDENAEQRPYLIGKPETGWIGGEQVLGTGDGVLAVRTGAMGANLNTRFKTWTAPEHGIMSYWIAMRCPPLLEKQGNPYASTEDWTYADWTGHPIELGSMAPVGYKERQFIPSSESSTFVGYMPRGQQLRTGWNSVHRNFLSETGNHEGWPIQRKTTPNTWRYHQTLDHLFLSDLWGNAIGSLYFDQTSHSMVPDIAGSIYAGAKASR